MLIKSALRDLLSVSYGKISILLTGSLRSPGRLYGFRRQRRHKKWHPKGRHTFPAERYYITPEGESPQTACKAKPITGRTLGAQGRKARRRHQPSRRSRVNLREYWKAPPGSRSRSRPRHRRFTSQAPFPIHLKKEGKSYASKNSTQNH